jgi:hypothetical protein
MKNSATILLCLLSVCGSLFAGCSNRAASDIPERPTQDQMKPDRSKMTAEDQKKMEEGMRRMGEMMKKGARTQPPASNPGSSNAPAKTGP